MAFTLWQRGDNLSIVDSTGIGGNGFDITLPTGVTLRTDVPPRFLVSGNYAIVVNTPSQPLLVDGSGLARLLAPRAPRLAPTLSNVNGGNLSGTFLSRYTFVITDEHGNLLAESDYSPLSNSATITTDYLKVAGLDISPDAITGRRIYRSTTNGSTLFQWIDLDGNILTETQDDLPDAGLSLFAAPTLGTPPYLTHIAEFRGRLFGVGGTDPDNLRYTEAGIRYAWPEDNIIPIQPIGSDAIGITAFLPRRDALGVARQNQLWQIVGSGEEVDGIADLQPVRLSEILGCLSQETVAIYRDRAYFLWYDGVYAWDSGGIECISDGREGKGNVRSWFATDDYFDRTRFSRAFAAIDPIRLVYKLCLDDPDGNKRWVEYDLKNGTWWGPHKTLAFVPTSLFAVRTSDDAAVNAPMFGAADGDLYQEVEDRTDEELLLAGGAQYGIEMDVISKRHDADAPDHDKFFGELSVFQRSQDKGTATVTSRVGELDDEAPELDPVDDPLPRIERDQDLDLTKTRARLGRLGQGKHAELEFTHDELDEDVELFGYDINPVHIVGRR